MVREVSKEGIASVLARGGMATPVPKEPPPEVKIQGLDEIMGQILGMKQEKMDAWKESHAAKLEKLDEMIQAIKENQLDIEPLTMLMAELVALKAAHEAREVLEDLEDDDDDHDDEPCEYKLTGRRDRRGLIDLEYGLTFTPVKSDE